MALPWTSSNARRRPGRLGVLAQGPVELVVEVAHRPPPVRVQVGRDALAEHGQGAAALGLTGADGDAEDLGGLGLRQLLVVAQRETARAFFGSDWTRSHSAAAPVVSRR